MGKAELRARIFSKIDELPTLPVVLAKLLGLMESDQSDAANIAEAISHDPALTSKILKVANSAYYGFSQQVSSLDKAVPLLGLNMVRSLALSIGVMDSFPVGKKKTNGFSREDLWIHSLAVATAIQDLARETGKPIQGEHLFVVGLLHDIGKIVLDQFFSEAFNQALASVKDGKDPSPEMAERRFVGMDHGEVGTMLLKRWKFPPAVYDPISVHHGESALEGVDPVDLALLRISDALAKELGFGAGPSSAGLESLERDLITLEMDAEALSPVKSHLIDAKAGISDFFIALK